MVVKIICAGKLKEKFYIEAFEEYKKRLNGFCKLDVCEIQETRLSDNPSQKEIDAALEKEAKEIEKNFLKNSFIVAMCIEGRQMDSIKFADFFKDRALSGKPDICFVMGSSFGMAERIKKNADIKLSMSEMTFPHHLARVMLAEQIYRAFNINNGSRYHK